MTSAFVRNIASLPHRHSVESQSAFVSEFPSSPKTAAVLPSTSVLASTGPDGRRPNTDASHPGSSGPASTPPTAGSSDLTQQGSFLHREKGPISPAVAVRSSPGEEEGITKKNESLKAAVGGIHSPLARGSAAFEGGPGSGEVAGEVREQAALRSLLAEFQGSPADLLALMQRDEEAEEAEIEEGGSGLRRVTSSGSGGAARMFDVEPLFSGGMMEALLGRMEEQRADEDVSSPAKKMILRNSSLQVGKVLSPGSEGQSRISHDDPMKTLSTTPFPLRRSEEKPPNEKGGIEQQLVTEEPAQRDPVVADTISLSGGTKRRRLSERKRPENSTSRFRGVTHHIRTGRWESHIWRVHP
ncbi:AP2/ERF domain containing protein [Klebsormidium nitens]|uniref:AP2/ERF domain containing protein n=1 Tax=Klebsormidium nitens TaxID=105231 RepID=A0A1Y1I014_KLENI|nr:AP2/ERF domain containing protein [Klebsormidium nitens]|eukprot:GAQ82769.1 AP2/ERF domain containing protein [Klebsormidium nitens]